MTWGNVHDILLHKKKYTQTVFVISSQLCKTISIYAHEKKILQRKEETEESTLKCREDL